MDNRIFNVNGRGTEMLTDTLKLVFTQWGKNSRCVSWRFNKDKGLILKWHAEDGDSILPSPMTAEECIPMIVSWLNSGVAKNMTYQRWDADEDHDGENCMGWRVYCEDWGHVDDSFYAICAVRPVYLWYGK